MSPSILLHGVACTTELAMPANDLLLVKGVSGFVGSHCVVALLDQGYRVRTPTRAPSRVDDVREMLKFGGVADDLGQGVQFRVAELTKGRGEDAAGAMRTFRDAELLATHQPPSTWCVYGHRNRGGRPFAEDDWTLLDASLAYPKSKTISKNAAWEWLAKEGGDMELSTVNPGRDLRPDPQQELRDDPGADRTDDERQSSRGSHRSPRASSPSATVADLHPCAVTDPRAAGQRFLATDEDVMALREVASTLQSRLGSRASKMTTRQLPGVLVRVVGRFDSGVALLAEDLGEPKQVSSAKARPELGWRPRGREEALVAAVVSLERFELLK
ncbi:hypothetical protein LTR53_011117 [Teratosphaeriaceae sp. CCFEE 6253]|nr:hypothetical protein LTR53_011117 [Teratosphaeriaceae sp. CCFEE 6253]